MWGGNLLGIRFMRVGTLGKERCRHPGNFLPAIPCRLRILGTLPDLVKQASNCHESTMMF